MADHIKDEIRARSQNIIASIPNHITLNHLAPTIGTEILGIDLTKAITAEEKALLHELLIKRKVIFFREQDITVEQHIEFCRNWGELEEIPFLPSDQIHKEVLTIEHNKDSRGYENIWHSDVTWRESPSLGSALRSLEVPEVGGDTMFADMVSAYENLPEWMKDILQDRQAVHSVTVSLGTYVSEAKLAEAKKKYPPAEHPAIRTHPETGEKILYVNRAHTSHLRGMSQEDSRKILEYLYAQSSIPEFQCRFKWRKNSIAFWDNRSCQHYAVQDYFPALRKMQRVTVAGDKPF